MYYPWMNVFTLLGILFGVLGLVHETASLTCGVGQILALGSTTTYTNGDATQHYGTITFSQNSPTWTVPADGQIVSVTAGFSGNINNGQGDITWNFYSTQWSYYASYNNIYTGAVRTVTNPGGASSACSAGDYFRFSLSVSGGMTPQFQGYVLNSGALYYSIVYQPNVCVTCAAGEIALADQLILPF